MKITPPSGDMLLKIALIAGGLGLIWYAGNRIASAGTSVVEAAGQAVNAAGQAVFSAANAVSPLNNENVIYHTANWMTGGGADTTLGGRIYDFFNPDPLKK